MKTYGYCRISTGKQNIERQVRNILAAYPDAIIRKEVYTGTKFQGRKELDKILKVVQAGDTIVFDSVSRMSRDADAGIELYMELYEKGVELVFLKESYINTAVYKKALQNRIKMTGDKVDLILQGVNEYLMELAKDQIRIAFEQSEKEVADLHQRTKEGIETARLNGKQIGRKTGTKIATKKYLDAKEIILKHNKGFGGTLSNEETWKLAGITKPTFYAYVKQLKQELNKE